MTRYFMTIPEAAQLVIQAGAMATRRRGLRARHGRAGAHRRPRAHDDPPVGPDRADASDIDGDIEIEFIGLRPGEKLFEELLIGDDVVPSDHPRIMCARERYIEPALLDKMLESLRAACEANDLDGDAAADAKPGARVPSADEVNAEASASLAKRERSA